MKVTWQQSGEKLVFSIELEQGDSKGPFKNYLGAQRTHKLVNKSFFVDMPKKYDSSKTHIDLFALTAVILFDRFADNRIVLSSSVSRRFHDCYKKLTGKKILPVDNSLKARQTTKQSVPALAFSVGTDSTAAMALLPKNTELIFLERVKKDNKNAYNKTAALQACSELQKKGKKVHIIKSDVEYLIDPITFVHPLAQGVPAILLSDFADYDCLAFGNTLENMYNLHNNQYVNDKTQPLRKFDELFQVCGLPVGHVVGGLSTYGTTLIQQKSGLSGVSQSCMYGSELGKPCNACIKCLTKISFQKIIENEQPEKEFIDSTLGSASFAKEAQQSLLHVQCVYMFLSSKIKNHKAMNLLAKKMGSHKYDMGWFAQWYSDAEELIPNKYRHAVVKNIKKHVKIMGRNNKKVLQSWDIRNQAQSPTRKFWHYRFWQEYSKRYDHHLLKLSHENIELRVGQKLPVKVYKYTWPWLKKDVSTKAKWGTKNSTAAYYKDGELRAKKTGTAILNVRYGNTKISQEVIVSR